MNLSRAVGFVYCRGEFIRPGRLKPPLQFFKFDCVGHRCWLIAFCLAFMTDLNAETYRWKDEAGNTHYSDQVPPEQARQRRVQLDAQGREISVVEVAKTPEQWAHEEKLKRLYAERKRILTEQHDLDLSLLRTYRNEEEMNLALQGKLSSMDSAIKVTVANRQRQEQALAGLEKRAAEAEIKGASVVANLRETIEETRRQISSYQEKTQRLEVEKQGVIQRFNQDIEHFKRLKESPQRFRIGFPSEQGPSEFVACKSCEKSWARAKAYVQAHSNLTPWAISTDRILQTAAAIQDKDISMTLVRVQDKSEDYLLLELNCAHSNLGDVLCQSPEVEAIRAGFKAFIKADDKFNQDE